MSAPSNVLSQTLQSITGIKLRELEKQRSSFVHRKAQILEDVRGNDRERVEALLVGLTKLQGKKDQGASSVQDVEDDLLVWEVGTDLSASNIKNFLCQSKYDPSTPSNLLPKLQDHLRQILDQRDQKFVHADLYSRLLTEWLQSDAGNETALGDQMDGASDDGTGSEVASFEVVEKQKERLKQLSEKFESVVFSPLDVDVTALTALLHSLFESEEAKNALNRLRKRINSFGKSLSAREAPFDDDSLRWSISGVLKSDLLSDLKKNTLEDFLKDDVVLSEIADVLNMRFADLENWTWDADEGIPVEPRRQLNGKYRVVMDEDILQSIFLHYIGTMWAVEFKGALTHLVNDSNVWQWTEQMPRDQEEKWKYYNGENCSLYANAGVSHTRSESFMKDFFMCQLPSTVDNDLDYEGAPADAPNDEANPPSVKQQLLRTLGTEVCIHRFFNKEVALVQSDLQWFATSTSHVAINTLLKFFSVPSMWRDFFRKYLQAPLRIIGLEGESGEVRTRKRGVPIGHVFQKWFGELIIFTMDVAVNQKAGMLLYRLHDDLWLCGQPSQCAKAWETMTYCAKVLGVEFNKAKTGSVYVTNGDVKRNDKIAATLPKGRVICGFLELEAETGRWVIDQNQVDAHVKQLSRQLAECSSVFAWIQTWNSCIGRFFNYTFGQPANCFGRNHVNMILETHKRIQVDLFTREGSKANSAVEYLKILITERFKVESLPDAFVYFPEEMGGLGLRNPFLSFLVVRDVVVPDPYTILGKYLEDERQAYKAAKARFDATDATDREKALESIIGKDGSRRHRSGGESKARPRWGGPTNNDFPSFEEYTQHRVSSNYLLKTAYDDLLRSPRNKNIVPSDKVVKVMKSAASAPAGRNWRELSSDRRWLIELYGEEVIDRFGGLALVDKRLLPTGVMNILRKRKVLWQAAL